MSTGAASDTRPAIGRGFRLQWEAAQDCHVLLYPEGMVKLNQSAGEILKRCDGERDVAAIVADLETSFGASGLEKDVLAFLDMARQQKWVQWWNAAARPGPPLWLLAELTYRCPLHCVFCYNPVDFARHDQELSTDDWLRVLREAREQGSVQCGFSGGEPMLRDDLEVLVAEAHRLGYYTNLLTSGVGLDETRIADLKAAGLDHIQLSFQDSTREVNDFLSHTRTFDLKEKVAARIKAHSYPMVMNVVIHRLNIDHIDRIIGMADALGAEYLELANSQYYSWAQVNRDHLLPTREQIERAEAVTARWRKQLDGRMRIFFVVPDYHETRPKRCMNGWGNVFLTITPDGTALPCHTARMLPGLDFPNVRDMSVHDIWYESEGFNHYRGTGWMKEPCASCDEKEKDLGGCRCQAYMLTRDPAAADPVCAKSPQHHLITDAVARAEERGGIREHPLVFRGPAESRRLTEESSD